MSLKDCIDAALQQNHITQQEADYLKKRYDSLASRILDPSRVKGQLTAEIAAEAQERQRKAVLSERARKSLLDDMSNHRNARGEVDLAEAYVLAHENVGSGKMRDATFNRLAILGHVHAQLEGALYEFRRGAWVGDLRRTSGYVGNQSVQVRLKNVVKELFGENSGDADAKAFAKVFSDVSEDLRVRFNAAGGSIPKLEKWGLPQFHSQEALIKVGMDKWIGRLMQPGVLDRDRMVHPLTKLPLTDAELRESLQVAYQRIVTDGWVDREAAGVSVGKAISGQHTDHRFIHFKDTDAWVQYAKDFGNPDPYQALMSHFSMMARDIAHMERFGPNPNTLREYAKQVVEKDAAMKGGDAVNTARKAINKADAMWEVMRGNLNTPVGDRFAYGMTVARNLITASSLGSALVSSLSDTSTGGLARAFVGMGAARVEPIRVIADAVKYIGVDNRREAVRAGLILDSALHMMHQQARYTGTIDTRSLSGFLADRVISAQGLAAWTQGGKHAFGMAMQAMFADYAAMPWRELPKLVRDTLDRHGFDKASWDEIRVVRLHEPAPGAVFLRPTEIRTVAGAELSERYLAMILRETRHAVVESTMASSAHMMGGTKPGTLAGELVRSFAQFKSFPVALVSLHQQRIAQQFLQGNRGVGAAYAGALLISSTLMGLMVMALKDVKEGRDPRRWADPANPIYIDPAAWGAAMLQGGGLGIYGDFLFAQANRQGGGLAQTVAGPIWDRLGAIKDLTMGNAQKAYEGKKTDVGRDISKIVRQNFPGGNLWMWNLPAQRMVFDQIQSIIDPEAHKAFHHQIQTRRKDYKQDFWWAPGEPAPSRAPNLGAIKGQ